MKRRDYRKRTQSVRYISNRDVDMNRQSDHRLAIRSLSMMEKEIAQEKMNMQDERALVALPAHQSALTIGNPSQDLPLALEYQENALVVYDDEQIRFTLEPEGSKIEDLKPESAVALYMPPKKSKGATRTTRKKSRRDHHVHVPPDELHSDVSNWRRRMKAQFQDADNHQSFISIKTLY